MRIGSGIATGIAISHSRWPSWCAELIKKSDSEEDVVWSKVGEGAPRQTYEQTSNNLHTVFYVRELRYGKFVKPACCTQPKLCVLATPIGLFPTPSVADFVKHHVHQNRPPWRRIREDYRELTPLATMLHLRVRLRRQNNEFATPGGEKPPTDTYTTINAMTINLPRSSAEVTPPHK